MTYCIHKMRTEGFQKRTTTTTEQGKALLRALKNMIAKISIRWKGWRLKVKRISQNRDQKDRN